MTWDAFSCPSADYNLIFGELPSVSSLAIADATCAVGPTGGYIWTGVPSADLFFLVVGTDLLGIYESSWGRDSFAAERNGTKASFFCGATTKVVSSICIAPN